MNIVGISGQARSGKDTAADYLVEHYKFEKIALADPIKEFGQEVFKFTKKQLWGPSESRNLPDKRYTDSDSPGWKNATKRLDKFGAYWVVDVIPNHKKRLNALEKLHDWFGWLRKNHNPLSPRVMLQTLGTEWGRSLDNDIWIKHLLLRSDRIIKSGVAGIVVSDVRFRNELQAIRDVGGELVRVVRPTTDAQAANTGLENHISEADQKSFSPAEFDLVINNNGTLEELYQSLTNNLNCLLTTEVTSDIL